MPSQNRPIQALRHGEARARLSFRQFTIERGKASGGFQASYVSESQRGGKFEQWLLSGAN